MDYTRIYAGFLKKFLKIRRPLKVVFDCSNGSAGPVIKKISNLVIGKLEIILINEKPDGRFPAHGPNPMAKGATDDLRKAVSKNKADLGVIFDADGDRAFFIDDLGEGIHSDITAALIGKNYKGPVILDVRAGYLARELISKVIDSRVGHYFIKKLMRQRKAPFAAETSGHYYFKDFFYADSGIFAAIQFMNAASEILKKGKKLSGWIDSLPKYYRSGEINFRISDKKAVMKKAENLFKKEAKKISHLDGLKMEFGPPVGQWWFSLRPSNTEDLLRLNLEAKDEKVFKKALKAISALAN